MNIFSSVTNAQYEHPGQKVLESLALLQEAHTSSEKENALQRELIVRLQVQDVQRQELITQLQEKVEVLEADEIRRLKKRPPKPDIKPNSRPPDDSPGDPLATGQRLEWLRAIYDYLTDRLKGTGLFLRLSGIIENASLLLACGLPGVTE